jgi:hypothetical protein
MGISSEGVEKDETEFHKNNGSKDGLQSWCKDCAFAYNVIRRAQPGAKARRAAYDAASGQQYERFVRQAVHRAIHSSRKAGQWVPEQGTEKREALMQKALEMAAATTLCPHLGYQLKYAQSGNGKPEYNTASLDHIIGITTDPSRILDPSNWEWVSWRYNDLKGVMSRSELLATCRIIHSGTPNQHQPFAPGVLDGNNIYADYGSCQGQNEPAACSQYVGSPYT